MKIHLVVSYMKHAVTQVGSHKTFPLSIQGSEINPFYAGLYLKKPAISILPW